MDASYRLKIAIDYLKKSHNSLTNEGISKALRYRSPSYVSDILGASKPINSVFLDKLKDEYSINPEYILLGKEPMVLPKQPAKAVNKEPDGLSWEQYAKKLEEDKAWYQRALESSLATVLKGVVELAEGQKDILAYQQGLVNHLEGSALSAAKAGVGSKGSGASKKGGTKTGTRAQ